MDDFWGKQLSLKAASGVCNIYKSRPHVKRRKHEKRAQFGARPSLRAELAYVQTRKTKRKSVQQNAPIPLNKEGGEHGAKTWSEDQPTFISAVATISSRT